MSPPGLEALGVTITAGMLFLAGGLGAWCRVVLTKTQANWSQRTVVDLLIGGCGGVLLPIFEPLLNPLLHVEFRTWTALQQAVLALILGGSGSYFWTAIGWRTGLIVTAHQAATGRRPPGPPDVGVLRGTTEAEPHEPLNL